MAQSEMERSSLRSNPTAALKLSPYSLPLPHHHRPQPPEMPTPPLHRHTASVPFRWEDAPGRPKRGLPPSGSTRRSLDLPPRHLVLQPSKETRAGAKATHKRSHTMIPILRGPIPPPTSKKLRLGWNWRRYWRGNCDRTAGERTSTSSSSTFSSMSMYHNRVYDGGCNAKVEGEEEETLRVITGITGMKRSYSESEINSSQVTANWLANVYGILRQAIPQRTENKL